jgi:hypothetical protein
MLLVATGAAAQRETVRVGVAPSNVSAGDSLFITAAVSPARASCTATITRPGALASRLARKRASRGVVSWRWTVPKAAKGGVGVARVVCSGAGVGLARFRITAPPPPPPPSIPARVVVVKSGFAQGPPPFEFELTDLGYGVVLQNVSPDEDALDVSVLVNIRDSSGVILDSETDTYPLIPAGATYYAGGDSFFEGTAARLEITVTVGERRPKSAIELPQVANLRVEQGLFDEADAEVTGEVVNPSTSRTLSDLSEITFVAFDGAGNVIGGGREYLMAEVPPGGRVGFRTTAEGLSPSQIASVQASVEPDYY